MVIEGLIAPTNGREEKDPSGSERASSEGTRYLFLSLVTSTYQNLKKQEKAKHYLVTICKEPL
jgi:hypothetical protein